MTKHERLEEFFHRFLISATDDEVEASRRKVLDRVRESVRAEQRSPAHATVLSYGDYHILRLLFDGERHGYAIMTEIATLTEGATTFGPGAFYTSISRLLSDGLIKETKKIADLTLNDEPRQYYRLTRKGQQSALVESERWASREWALQEQRGLMPL